MRREFMARTEPPRIAVLGAGPIGLEAALYAAALQLPFTIYEAGRVCEHLHRWGHVRLFSPFAMNGTPLGRNRVRADEAGRQMPGAADVLTGREHLAAYLEPLAASPTLRDHIRTQTHVLQVGRSGFVKEENPGEDRRGRQPFRVLLRGADGRERFEEADVVLDCTGTYGRHRFLGDGGILAAGEAAAERQIAYGLEDILGERRAHYADKTTIVVGGGFSAATTVSNLATLAEKHPSTWVIWLSRGAGTQPIKRVVNDTLRERDRLAVRANTLATRSDACVEFHPQTVIDSVECGGPDGPFAVHGRRDGKATKWEGDRLIANVGYTPNERIYRELQVHECYATLGPMALATGLLKHASGDCLTVPAQGAAALRCPEPNFFLLGSKSYGRNSAFLLRAGFTQVREVFTLITGRADLDLYAAR
jgi:thioredoxin reductase